MIKKCKTCGNNFDATRSIRDYCSRECANKATGKDRAAKDNPGKLYTVWSCGGGIQSTAIAVLIENGELPKPDFAIMVNCGYEKATTLKYVTEIIVPRMEKAGVKLELVDTLKYTNNNLVDDKGHVNIPAFRLRPDGSVSKLHTHCNNTWKVRVARIWLKEQGVTNGENWLGISADEPQRIKQSPLKWIKYRYPLFELGMSREECIYKIALAGWPMPTRTSCIFCPLQDNRAWEHLRNHSPDDWAKALEVEKIIQSKAPDVYLHKKCLPLEEIFQQ